MYTSAPGPRRTTTPPDTNRTLDTIGQLYRHGVAGAHPESLQRRRQRQGPAADIAYRRTTHRIADDESHRHAAVFGRPGFKGAQAGTVGVPTVAIPLVAQVTVVERHQTEATVGYRSRIRPSGRSRHARGDQPIHIVRHRSGTSAPTARRMLPPRNPIPRGACGRWGRTWAHPDSRHTFLRGHSRSAKDWTTDDIG